MRTLLIVLVVILAIILVVLLVLLGIVLVRFGRRSYQRNSGLERQRGAAKQSRMSGFDRLKGAERQLVAAQRELVQRGAPDEAQAIERLRSQMSTLADRLRYATYGYAPLDSASPIREAELGDLQQRDANTIADAQQIADVAEVVHRSAADGRSLDLLPLRSALDLLQESLDRRKAVN